MAAHGCSRGDGDSEAREGMEGKGRSQAHPRLRGGAREDLGSSDGRVSPVGGARAAAEKMKMVRTIPGGATRFLWRGGAARRGGAAGGARFVRGALNHRLRARQHWRPWRPWRKEMGSRGAGEQVDRAGAVASGCCLLSFFAGGAERRGQASTASSSWCGSAGRLGRYRGGRR